MVKFLIGLITGVLLVFLGFIFLVFVLVQFREKPPRIAENSVLVLRLEGDVPEKPPLELPAFLGAGGPTLTVAKRLDDVTESRRRCAYQGHRAGAGRPLHRLGQARGDPRRRGAVPQIRQAGLRVPAGTVRARLLRRPGCQPHLPRPARAPHAEGAARGDDVLQEDAGEARRKRRCGARRQV